MIALSINLNKIALLRNSREGNYPDLLKHAKICIDAGVNGITVHPRPDQRHIRPNDVRQLSQLVTPLSSVEFNVEGNPFADARGDYPGFIELVEETMPDQCTLVPDVDDQLTSDHGFDLFQTGEKLRPIIQRLQQKGMRVSLFMDPEIRQIEQAKLIGADRIELYTGPYAAAQNDEVLFQSLLHQHREAAKKKKKIGLGVNAGHDLNLNNLPHYATIPGLQEVSIGHALTVDAIEMGLVTAVQTYLSLLHEAECWHEPTN